MATISALTYLAERRAVARAAVAAAKTLEQRLRARAKLEAYNAAVAAILREQRARA